MTTAVPSKPVPATPAPQPAKVIFQGRIALEKIDVRPQVRKKFDENSHKELTESVRTKDVISPVTLRPKGERYELVAGERRFRAAKAAGLPTIPAIVRELDDQAAALYQVEENIHRKDLTPIEEARGFKLLTQPGKDGKAKYNVEQLAALIKKDKTHVYRRLALLELPSKVLEMIEAGELTPEHGHQVLRVPPDRRSEVIAYISKASKSEGRYITAKELQRVVDEQLGSDLKAAPWPKDVPFAGKPACSTCPSNSGNQGMLIGGVVTGRCMAIACFQAKADQVEKDNAKELVAKYPGVKVVPKADKHDIERKHAAEDLSDVIKHPKVQKAIKENPEAFVMAMVNERDWDNGKRIDTVKPMVFVKKKHEKLILNAIGNNHPEAYNFGKTYSSSGGYSRPTETPKQRFVRRFALKAICAAFKPDLQSRAFWGPIVKDLRNAYHDPAVREFFQLGDDYHVKIDKVKTEDLPKLAFLMAAQDGKVFSSTDMKAAGVDLAGAMKKGKDAGEKEWERIKAEKAAARKKA